jgi:hypothetical protein
MDDHELLLHNSPTQSVNFVRTSSKQLCDSLEIHGVITSRTCVRLTDARLRELELPASSRSSGPVERPRNVARNKCRLQSIICTEAG